MRLDVEGDDHGWNFLIFDPALVPQLLAQTKTKHGVSPKDVEREVESGLVIKLPPESCHGNLRLLIDEEMALPTGVKVKKSSPGKPLRISSGQLWVMDMGREQESQTLGQLNVAPGSFDTSILEVDGSAYRDERIASEGVKEDRTGILLGIGCAGSALFVLAVTIVSLTLTIDAPSPAKVFLIGLLVLLAYWALAVCIHNLPGPRNRRRLWGEFNERMEKEVPSTIAIFNRRP